MLPIALPWASVATPAFGVPAFLIIMRSPCGGATPFLTARIVGRDALAAVVDGARTGAFFDEKAVVHRLAVLEGGEPGKRSRIGVRLAGRVVGREDVAHSESGQLQLHAGIQGNCFQQYHHRFFDRLRRPDQQ